MSVSEAEQARSAVRVAWTGEHAKKRVRVVTITGKLVEGQPFEHYAIEVFRGLDATYAEQWNRPTEAEYCDVAQAMAKTLGKGA